jgi:hypothetical protein
MMKGFAPLYILVPVIIAGIFGTLYLTNFPLTEVSGEKIGFADFINFLLFQFPPNVPEADYKSNQEISGWFSTINGSEAGQSLGAIKSLGNTIKVCVFNESSYCDVFKIESGKIYETSDAPQRTIYVSYQFALELKQRAETGNYEGLDRRMVQAIKSGDIKGIMINDVLNMNK